MSAFCSTRRSARWDRCWHKPVAGPSVADGGTSGTHASRGRLNELLDRSAGNEAPAANDDAGELSGPEETVDRVPRNATEELTDFLDGVERAVLHGAVNAVKGGAGPYVIWLSGQ